MAETVADTSCKEVEYKYVNRDEIDKDLCCCICVEPFVQPVSVPGCEHIFCKECIEQVRDNKCPTCRALFQQSQLKPAHRLIVQCTNNGCSWNGTRGDHAVHRKECTFEKVPCEFCRFGCTFVGTRGQAEKHVDESCQFKELRLFFKSYEELEKKVQVLEKKVESLQKGRNFVFSNIDSKGGSGSQSQSPGAAGVRAPSQTTRQEEEQLKALHEKAMKDTQERNRKEREEAEKKKREQEGQQQ